MQSTHEKSIVRNIFNLTKETINVNLLASELCGINQTLISNEELQRILSCADEDSKCNLLYETILRQSINAQSFAFLINVLNNTENGELARILEESLHSIASEKTPTKLRKFSQLTKRVSCSDFYEGVLGSKLIVGREMGISEILEEEVPNLRKDCTRLIKLLDLSSAPIQWEHIPDFVVQSTLILREWTLIHRKGATVGKLISRMNLGKHYSAATRIRKMFERADNFEEKWEIDAKNCRKSISGKEMKLVQILDANPSFCLHPERLFLLLNLPMEFFLLCTSDTNFLKNGMCMFKLWKELNERDATIQKLYLLCLENGHPFTAEKVLKLLR